MAMPFPIFFFFFLLSSSASPSSTCSQNLTCPTFPSPTLPYPFSLLHPNNSTTTTNGHGSSCGHPSFQINCTKPNSSITINTCSYNILSYKPNNRTILLSLSNCSSNLTIHDCGGFTPLSLSSSPFSFTSSTCSKLSSLRPCNSFFPSSNSSSSSSYCSLWQRKVIDKPSLLLSGCHEDIHSSSSSGSEAGVCAKNGDFLGGVKELLEGIEVEWSEEGDYFKLCGLCRIRGGVCGFNQSDANKGFLCYVGEVEDAATMATSDLVRNGTQVVGMEEEGKGRMSKKVLAGVCALIVGMSVFFLALVLILLIRKVSPHKWRLKPTTADEGVLLHGLHSSNLHGLKTGSLYLQQNLPPVFTYEELDSSTNSFDQKRKLGDGGFGSVYLGQFKDGSIVAVKKLYKHHLLKHQQLTLQSKKSTNFFVNEILILSALDHPNLVRLRGYCTDQRGLLLVYEYVPNGTLADHLHGHQRQHKSLSWHVRLSIAIQIAQALEYLHFSVKPPIVHRDVTSSNIFLNKDFSIKVGDFGLSRLLHPSSSGGSGLVWTGPQGTPGYLDPDYYHSYILSEKSDVYSFGVILLELISGKKAVDTSREKQEMGLADLMVSKIQIGSLLEMVDADLLRYEDCKEGVESGVMMMVRAVAELAFRCVAADKDDRPDIKEVVEQLKRIPTSGGHL